jgi:hypothetical protein
MGYRRGRDVLYLIKFVNVAGRWFSPGTPLSFNNKTNCHEITEILL